LLFQLQNFRLQIKNAACYVSDASGSLSADDEDNDVVQVVKLITSERATFRAEMQVNYLFCSLHLMKDL
jgi:hypothetical protein